MELNRCGLFLTHRDINQTKGTENHYMINSENTAFTWVVCGHLSNTQK